MEWFVDISDSPELRDGDVICGEDCVLSLGLCSSGADDAAESYRLWPAAKLLPVPTSGVTCVDGIDRSAATGTAEFGAYVEAPAATGRGVTANVLKPFD